MKAVAGKICRCEGKRFLLHLFLMLSVLLPTLFLSNLSEVHAQGDTVAQWKILPVQVPFDSLFSRFRPSLAMAPFFLDSLHGYCRWEKFTAGDTAGVGLYATSDGGEKWERVYRSMPIPHDLKGMFGLAPDGRMTTDGGTTWRAFRVDSFDSLQGLVYDGLSAGGFPQRMAGFTPLSGRKRLVFTTDGGATWTRADTVVVRKDWRDTTQVIPVISDTTLFGVMPVDATTGQFRWESFLGMNGDTLCVTVRKVSPAELSYRSDYLWAINLRTRTARQWAMDTLDRFVLSNLHRTEEGMLYGWNYPRSVQTYFVRSLDGGRTWDSVGGLPWADFNYFHFLSPSYGISSNARTTDGGATWSRWGTQGTLGTFFPLDSLHLFATGARTFLRSADGGGSWITSGNFWTLTGIDAVHAWKKRAIVGGGPGNLLVSMDSAETWTNLRTIPGALPNGFDRLRAIAVPDPADEPNRVVALASCATVDPGVSTACIMESTDGGLTWQSVRHPASFDSVIQGEWSMQFVPNIGGQGVTGFLQGGSPRSLYRSTDGGLSWEFVTEETLTLLAMADDTYGVAGREGQLLRTTDGGSSWTVTRTYTAPLRFTYGLTAFDRNRYAGILPNNLQIPYQWRPIHSSDGALTWSLLNGLTYQTNDPGYLHWRSPREVYSLSEMGLYYSSDSGKRFSRLRDVLRWGANMMVTSDGSYLYQFSADSARVGRWRIQDFASSVQESEANGTLSFACLELPARDVLRLRYHVSGAVSVTGGLYDIWGREAAAIPAERFSGDGVREFDVSGLASGLYFLRLQADGKEIVRPVQVLR